MKDGDIYRWRYNEDELIRRQNGNNGGTTYWCVSNIGIWNKEQQKLIDTYWTSDNRYFTKEDIKNKLILEYIGNLNNLRPCEKYEFNNYDDKDCINISHPNMSRGGFYIKKNAKPSLAKKRKVIKAHIKYYEDKINYYTWNVENLKKDLSNLTIETIVPCNSDVYI